MDLEKPLIMAAVFSLLGLVVYILGFVVMDRLTPYHLWNELTEKKNNAVAIVVGSISIGIALIISSAIHG